LARQLLACFVVLLLPAIDEKGYGPDHPNVARDLNNLARLLRATNRLSEADLLIRRAPAIYENSYGSNHPSVVTAHGPNV
jgi:tetratricopeptide repeat protein